MIPSRADRVHSALSRRVPLIVIFFPDDAVPFLLLKTDAEISISPSERSLPVSLSSSFSAVIFILPLAERVPPLFAYQGRTSSISFPVMMFPSILLKDVPYKDASPPAMTVPFPLVTVFPLRNKLLSVVRRPLSLAISFAFTDMSPMKDIFPSVLFISSADA